MMFWRTKPKMYSSAAWPRPGTIFMLRVPSQNTTMMMTTTRMRMSITRSSSNGVPSNSRTGGKNSSMEGPWNPPSSSLAAALAIRDATWVSSGGSGFGAPT